MCVCVGIRSTHTLGSSVPLDVLARIIWREPCNGLRVNSEVTHHGMHLDCKIPLIAAQVQQIIFIITFHNTFMATVISSMKWGQIAVSKFQNERGNNDSIIQYSAFVSRYAFFPSLPFTLLPFFLSFFFFSFTLFLYGLEPVERMSAN